MEDVNDVVGLSRRRESIYHRPVTARDMTAD